MLFFAHTRSGRGRCNAPGFTMIEIIAVIVILGVISAVLVSRFSLPDTDLSGRVDLLKAQLRYAQYRAMNSSSSFGLHFNSGTYVLFDSGNVANTHRLPGEDDDLVDLSAEGFSFTAGGSGTFDVSFDSWGTPYVVADPDGAAPQAGDRGITVSLNGKSATVTVTQNTGYVP